ncbi:hypothetical protein GGR50DRAFT_631525 [Xylaria sp. CBS 124048]|nr:hypothetical protein GGR50DRAFT_631525 [Xylaria sp. CBS 124048]
MRGLSKYGHSQLGSLWRTQSAHPRAVAPIFSFQQYRYKATIPGVENATQANIIDAIRTELVARPPQIHYDMMYPLNSHLLTKALSDFFPKGFFEKRRIPHERVYRNKDDTGGEPLPLSPGHHFVYFPLHLRSSELCPDGTDPYHSPSGDAYKRRVWSGGSLLGFDGLALDDGPAVCIERIKGVHGRGPEGAEKIFVDVLREYITKADFDYRYDPEGMRLLPHGHPSLRKVAPESRPGVSKCITERRTLVFMRMTTEKERTFNIKHDPQPVSAPNAAEWFITVTPTQALLFQFSALTYNAHKIHLDRAYCRNVEGYRGQLVQGPLSVLLMISALQSRLADDEIIETLNYRLLVPLYVDEPLRICIAMLKVRIGDDGRERKMWDVWIQKKGNSLCVRASFGTVKGVAALPS